MLPLDLMRDGASTCASPLPRGEEIEVGGQVDRLGASFISERKGCLDDPWSPPASFLPHEGGGRRVCLQRLRAYERAT
jgi:hypothetical protein